MEFKVLGPLEITSSEGPLPLGGRKQRLVLAHLIVRANAVVPTDVLIDEVWGEEPPDSVRSTLQGYVSHLRRVLGERLEGRTSGYVLHVHDGELDATAFEAKIKDAKRSLASNPAAAAGMLSEALGLWRGPALADLTEEPSLRGEIARLEEFHLAATEYHIMAEIAIGRHSTVVPELEALIARYPLRERLWAHLMLAQYRSGRQAEALATFERARQVLASELGADPSLELQHLHEQILRKDPELAPPSPAITPHVGVRARREDLAPGTAFAGYRIERNIGRGGMSVVYLAEHVRLKRKVALKVLSPELAEDERFRERFIRESELAASLEDPNVLPIYEAGEQDGVLFIAMRYLDGTDLKTLIERESPLEPARVAVIIGQVASALDAAHAKGLVHRDVKPGNILVTRTASSPPAEMAFLVDFGLTKRATSDSGLTGTGVFAGTLSYAAPEQFEGAPLDARTDVYSLGCVLFECLIESPPFRREQDAALMHAHLHEPPPRATAIRLDLPPAVDGVVAKAMAKRPDQRYQRASDLAVALRKAVAGEQEKGAAPPQRRRTRAWLTITVALAVLASAIAVVALSGGDGAPGPAPSATSSPTIISPGEVPPGSLLRIDPETGESSLLVREVPGLGLGLPVDPSLAVGEGGVWLYSFARAGFGGGIEAFLLHLDEETGEVRDRVPVAFTVPAGAALAVGSRTVWFSGGDTADTVSRLNPATFEPLDPVTVRRVPVTDIVLGGDVLWVGSSDGTLTEFDPLTGQRLGEIALGATPDELAFGEGAVWALDQLGNQVIRIDPASRQVTDRIDVDGNLEDVAAGDGGVWILDDLAGTVTRIDPETGATGDPVRVGPEPSAIAVGLGSAWITDAEDGKIYRVDPGLGSQEPIDVGTPLVAIAVDEATDTLWVGVLDPGD